MWLSADVGREVRVDSGERRQKPTGVSAMAFFVTDQMESHNNGYYKEVALAPDSLNKIP